ncbi:MAG TPA: hypothetical protein VD763_11175, partial [Candidatus Saccharimonadales bacterium]|nr:hypothetical protein [Candidatus Saccharimonadales bacterium]
MPNTTPRGVSRIVRGDSRPDRRASGRPGAALAAALTALALLLALVTPALAGSGPTRLSDASVSPRSAKTTTTIDFVVQYRNREGSPADWVRVKVAGETHSMTRSGGEDWKRLVTFKWSGKLPAGTHAVVFMAMSRDRFDFSLAAGSVTVAVAPTPTPEPTATPKPTPKPTATPTATPKPTARPTATPRPTPRPTASPMPTPKPTAAPT